MLAGTIGLSIHDSMMDTFYPHPDALPSLEACAPALSNALVLPLLMLATAKCPCHFAWQCPKSTPKVTALFGKP